MTSSLTCPSEEELLAVAAGEAPSEELRSHLDLCPVCSDRLKRRKVELAELQKAARGTAACPSTTIEPTDDPAASNGRSEHLETTEPWESQGRRASEAPSSEEYHQFRRETNICVEPPLPAAIGKYLVIDRFPPSGQAEVYRVAHPGLAKDLVLKLALHPMEAGGRRGVEEGRLLALLDHPNLVHVYDLDFHDDRLYLVMEYIPGGNLEQLASDRRMEPSQAAALVAKVAGAIDHAHRHGIIHRDIKPRNILVDEAGEPRLIDFGMARLRNAWFEDPGRPGGTFAFMPPEQARIESPEGLDKVGPHSDIFALGAVLYYLLTGKPPFTGQTLQECWDRARRCDFDRKALDDSKGPRALRRICLKAMAADPTGRHFSAEALQKALERYLRGPAVRAAVTGLFGLALLWILGYLVLPRPTLDRTVAAPASHTPIPIAAQPIKGRIDLLVVKSKDGTRRRLRLDDHGAVPVRANDEIRIEARIDRPAYLYLFWLGSEGKVAPLYPWKDHDWSKRPAEEQKVTGVELPEVLDDVLEIPASSPGLETLVLLAREDTPLPRDDQARFAQSLTGSPVPMPSGMSQAIWLEDGHEVAFGPADGRTRGGDSPDELSRGIPSPTTRKSDDPVLRVQSLLSRKLQPLGSYSQAVLFPNVGR
jgi:serine/threonine protein kinase